MTRARDANEFTLATKRLLAKRVNYLCSLCGCQTTGPKTGSDKAITLGDAAHIHSASPNGPRPSLSLTREQLRAPDNGIWLCVNHARLVDADESRYTVEELRALREKAETAAREALEGKKRPEALAAPALTFAPVNNFNPVVNVHPPSPEPQSSTLAMLAALGAQISFAPPGRTAARTTSEQWQQLGTQFNALKALKMELYWYEDLDGSNKIEKWALREASPEVVERTLSLARLAGRMLLTSEHVLTSLPIDVLEETDDVNRWWRYVAHLGGLNKDDVLTVVVEEGKEVSLQSAALEGLVHRSVTACIECAARQF